MPYISLTINPTQVVNPHNYQTSQIYTGFSTVNSAASNSTLYDYDLIKQNILNQFNVSQGERLMDPTFGTTIWHLLFEPFTSSVKSQIVSEVTRIANSDPRAKALSVNIYEQEYGMLLEVTLQYVGTDQTDVMKLNFDANVGLVRSQ
jgi:phage baseplate assembly protein W